MKQSCLLAPLALVFATCAVGHGDTAEPTGPQMANGFKVGDVTAHSAVVWARLTAAAEANRDGEPFARVPASQPQLPPGAALADMEGAVPGIPGEVRVVYATGADRRSTAWRPVDPAADCTRKFTLTGLRPGRRYDLQVEARAAAAVPVSCRLTGSFRTAPLPNAITPVSFCVIACQDWPRRDDSVRGHRIYETMLALQPDFLVHTGDTVYYDKPRPFATDAELARFKWNRFYALTWPREFHRQVSCYFLKDDHDTLKNDCWPGQSYRDLTWEQGLAIYREQLPVAEPPYRRTRWGRDLELWFVEGREQRSPNRMPDGPDKTIWGAEQWQWLQRTVAASDATFRVLVSPTPIVGPDRPNKNDNHSNRGFQHAGDAARTFLAAQPNTIVICGDRHWQYVSRDPATGLREFGCGPASDAHAGGFRESDRTPQHEYLRVAGGFLHVLCDRDEDGPRLVLSHRCVDGAVRNEVVVRPE